RHETLRAADAAEVAPTGVEDDEVYGLRRTLVEDADDLSELDAPDIEIASRRALHVDRDQEVFPRDRHAMPGVIEKADGIGSYRPQPVGEIVRRVQDLVAVRILDRGEDLKAHLGERRADNADVLLRVVQRADFAHIALVADHERDARFGERGRVEEQKDQQAKN